MHLVTLTVGLEILINLTVMLTLLLHKLLSNALFVDIEVLLRQLLLHLLLIASLIIVLIDIITAIEITLRICSTRHFSRLISVNFYNLNCWLNSFMLALVYNTRFCSLENLFFALLIWIILRCATFMALFSNLSDELHYLWRLFFLYNRVLAFLFFNFYGFRVFRMSISDLNLNRFLNCWGRQALDFFSFKNSLIKASRVSGLNNTILKCLCILL
jgi:hypothetical protein